MIKLRSARLLAVFLTMLTFSSGCISPAPPQPKIEEELSQAPAEPTPHQHEEKPEVGIALMYAPDPVVVGAEVKFSIWTSTGKAASGGSVIVGIEKGTVPMGTMTMMGNMVEAAEETPGNYTLNATFPEEGDYIIHVHFVPRGRSMMEMMKNHADFGPLRVFHASPTISMPKKVDIRIAPNAYDPNQNEDFVPETVTVAVGTTVAWRNDDVSSHTITEHEKSTFTSPLINPGESWSYIFNELGVYHYHCNPHLWMEGTIVVK